MKLFEFYSINIPKFKLKLNKYIRIEKKENMIIALEKQPIIHGICDHVFLGDIVASENTNLLKELNIKVIISLIKEENKDKREVRNIKHYNFGVEDGRNENISKFFPEINTIIKEFIDKKENILIHCYNAVSRSVTVLTAYLISTGMTLKDSLQLIKDKRGDKVYTKPNIGFMKQLFKYEREVLGCNSVSLSSFI